MSGKWIFGVSIIFAMIAGCNRQQSRTGATGHTPADVRKADLINQLDHKWENPDGHFQLGQAYHASGEWAKAQYHYNIALGFDPVHREAQAALVKVLLDSGDKEKSRVTADMYITQASSSASALLDLGIGFEKQGLDDYALNCYKQAVGMAPNSAVINKQLGYYYLKKKNNEHAKEYLIRSFQINANQPDVAGELGRLGVAVRIPRTTESESRMESQAVK
jgi:tetratricopeptide (TPR) repeat protein